MTTPEDHSTSTRRDASHVPTPAGGVRGVDQVDDMDPEQAAAIGPTDDPQDDSIQPHGSSGG